MSEEFILTANARYIRLDPDVAFHNMFPELAEVITGFSTNEEANKWVESQGINLFVTLVDPERYPVDMDVMQKHYSMSGIPQWLEEAYEGRL
tara:strand:- start:836 stop:1111 length:276 start_codon:yes stop_codon:yes gene_type:complete